jgi:phosphatidylinositol-3-phosphatase
MLTPAPATVAAPARVAGVPRYDHIVLLIEENHSGSEVLRSGQAPVLSGLAARGAVLAQSFAVTHPSEPNYLALFSGSTQGLTDDSCPHSYGGPNLAASLRAAGRRFVGYAESMPGVGFTGCSSGPYARKHNPWTDFLGLPSTISQPMTAFPTDYATLPNVAFVVPNLDHDMHDGSVADGDRWVQERLADYAAWAATHNSLLIVTADEDDGSDANRVPTLLVGAHVKVGTVATRINHYGLLRTMLAAFALPGIGASSTATPLATAWTS